MALTIEGLQLFFFRFCRHRDLMLSGPRFAHVGVLGLEDKPQNYEPAKPDLKLSVIPALALKLALN